MQLHTELTRLLSHHHSLIQSLAHSGLTLLLSLSLSFEENLAPSPEILAVVVRRHVVDVNLVALLSKETPLKPWFLYVDIHLREQIPI